VGPALSLVELRLTHLPIPSNEHLLPLFISFPITSLQSIVIVHQNHVRLISLYLERQKDSITRWHSLKLIHSRCLYHLQKI